VDDSEDTMIIELTGSEAFVLSCIRALERFGVVEVARSGTVALGSTNDIQSGTLP
jgi:acetolactate synthase small subunit